MALIIPRNDPSIFERRLPNSIRIIFLLNSAFDSSASPRKEFSSFLLFFFFSFYKVLVARMKFLRHYLQKLLLCIKKPLIEHRETFILNFVIIYLFTLRIISKGKRERKSLVISEKIDVFTMYLLIYV